MSAVDIVISIQCITLRKLFRIRESSGHYEITKITYVITYMTNRSQYVKQRLC